MIKHFYSKIAIAVYFLIFIGLIFWTYMIFKDRDGKTITTEQPTISNNSASSISPSDNANSDNNTDNQGVENANTTNNSDSTQTNSNFSAPISTTPEVNGHMFAHITPEHCNTDCQAFKIDLSLLEYCEQVCGISPIKNVSSCDSKKDIQKDYCLKDLAIIKKDVSFCEKITDANIKQTCKNNIEQTLIEDLQRNNPRSKPTF